MKLIMTAVIIAFFCSSCSKEHSVPPVPHPVMHYKNLQNAAVSYSHPAFIDVDDDGVNDFSFGVILVGDPLLQRDRLQFLANSKVNTLLLNNEQDQSPVLNKNDSVAVVNPGYQWFEISSIVLAEKITTMTGFSWEGLWITAAHKYLPVQLKKGEQFYNGWIELSFDTANEKLILHRAAISTERAKTIKAGF